jgi:type IV secretion system protein VirB9
LIVSSLLASASVIPTASSSDNRITEVSYRAKDVTQINTVYGYMSILELDKDEKVLDKGTGFDEGWSIMDFGNIVKIRPIVYVQQGEQTNIVEPYAKQWNTNLYIQTNKRTYFIDLRLITKTDEMNYKTTYRYKKEKSSDQKIKTLLDRQSVPKNWQYYLKVNKNSSEIRPSYVYDDGKFTYIGFSLDKSFPTPFEVDNENESLLNTSTKHDGNYNVLIIHKLCKMIYLRDGDKLVGILNAGHGKNHSQEREETSSRRVIREIIR